MGTTDAIEKLDRLEQALVKYRRELVEDLIAAPKSESNLRKLVGLQAAIEAIKLSRMQEVSLSGLVHENLAQQAGRPA